MREILVVVVAFFTIVIGGTVGVHVWVESATCSDIKRIYGLQTDVSVSLGCMVKYNGEWVQFEVVTKNVQRIEVK